ncbi:hypothetical protein GCM10027212_26250 [Actinotalea caeni]
MMNTAREENAPRRFSVAVSLIALRPIGGDHASAHHRDAATDRHGTASARVRTRARGSGTDAHG